jgi:hypothetical protein
MSGFRECEPIREVKSSFGWIVGIPRALHHDLERPVRGLPLGRKVSPLTTPPGFPPSVPRADFLGRFVDVAHHQEKKIPGSKGIPLPRSVDGEWPLSTNALVFGQRRRRSCPPGSIGVVARWGVVGARHSVGCRRQSSTLIEDSPSKEVVSITSPCAFYKPVKIL